MTESEPSSIDQDALDAALDLIGRTGAKQVELGFANEDAPTPEEAEWWASVTYKGAKISVDKRAGPVEAAEDLARKLMHGGMCTHCKRRITLSGRDNSRKYCRWTRKADKWVRGCP